MRLLSQRPPYVIVIVTMMGRTDRHFRETPVNLLTVGIADRGICFLIVFAALRTGGNFSADGQMKALDRFLRGRACSAG